MSSRRQQAQPRQGVTTAGAGLSGATTGVKLTYTCPAGHQAEVRYAAIANIAGTPPTVQIRGTINAVTVVLNSGTVAVSFNDLLCLNAGDTADINVSVLGAASTFDAVISALEFPAV